MKQKTFKVTIQQLTGKETELTEQELLYQITKALDVKPSITYHVTVKEDKCA